MGELYLAYDMEKEKMECSSHTVVIRNDALNAKYPGGLKGFVEKYNARCNRNITVSCGMGSSPKIVEKLHQIIDIELVLNQDFWMFDFGCYWIGMADFIRTVEPHEIDTGIDWLRCELAEEKSGSMKFYVWYVDAVEQSELELETDPYWEAFDLLKLWDLKDHPEFSTLEAGLKDIMNNPNEGLEYVKKNMKFLLMQIQRGLELS